MAAVPLKKHANFILWFKNTCLIHNIFRRKKSFLTFQNDVSLSFYFYFIKNAYLGFISSFIHYINLQALFIGKTSFQQLPHSMKEKFQETCVLHFPDTCIQRG